MSNIFHLINSWISIELVNLNFKVNYGTKTQHKSLESAHVFEAFSCLMYTFLERFKSSRCHKL